MYYRDLWMTGGQIVYFHVVNFNMRLYHNISDWKTTRAGNTLSPNLQWTPGPDLPIEISRHCQVNIGHSRVVVYGGLLENQRFSNDLWLYQNQTWKMVCHGI